MLRFLIGFLSVLFLVGCQPTVSEMRQAADKGVGGYIGAVNSFTVPILLRYEGPAKAVTDVSWWGSWSDGRSGNGGAKWSMSIQSLGEQRIWEILGTESSVNGRVFRSNGPPLISIRALSSARGPLREMNIEYPAFTPQQVREGMDKNPQLQETIQNQLRLSQPEFPERGIAIGDEIISGQDFIKILFAGELASDPEWRQLASSSAIRGNSVSLKVAGHTWRGGRQMLVVNITGAISLSGSVGDLYLSLRGYWLIDMKTGLTGEQFVASESRITRSGRLVTFERVTRTETTFL